MLMSDFMDQVSGFPEVAVEDVFPFTGARHSDFRNQKVKTEVFKNESSLKMRALQESGANQVNFYWMREKRVTSRNQTSKGFLANRSLQPSGVNRGIG